MFLPAIDPPKSPLKRGLQTPFVRFPSFSRGARGDLTKICNLLILLAPTPRASSTSTSKFCQSSPPVLAYIITYVISDPSTLLLKARCLQGGRYVLQVANQKAEQERLAGATEVELAQLQAL